MNKDFHSVANLLKMLASNIESGIYPEVGFETSSGQGAHYQNPEGDYDGEVEEAFLKVNYVKVK